MVRKTVKSRREICGEREEQSRVRPVEKALEGEDQLMIHLGDTCRLNANAARNQGVRRSSSVAEKAGHMVPL